jgi:hypothetical protein
MAPRALALWRRVRSVPHGRRWVTLAAGAIVWILGYLGYREVDNVPGTLTAMYHSLQLFVLESHYAEKPSWMLTVARFGAPIVAAAALVQAYYALFREQLERLGLRRISDHVVIVGLGNIGFGVAKAFHKTDCRVCRTSSRAHRVVVIEQNPANPSIAGARERGIAVVTGSAADPRVLAKTHLDRARHLIVTPGDDGAALDAVVAAAGVMPPGRRDLKALVHLDDLSLWRRLQAEILASPDRFPFGIEFFNVLDTGARALLKKHRPFADAQPGAGRPPHILLVGLEGVGEFVVLHVAGAWQAARGQSDERLRISIVGPNVRELAEALRDRYPELAGICDLSAESAEIGDARFQRGELDALDGVPQVDKAYVSLLDESAALSAALALRAQPRMHGVPIVVAVWLRERGVPSLIHEGRGALSEIEQFPVLSSTLGPGLLELATNEVLAELRHEHYVEREKAKGETRETNPSVAPWDELPDSLKESNRAFARHVGAKLAAKRCAVVPAPLTTPDGAAPLFDEDEVDDLACKEHARWMKDLILDDWKRTDGPKDAARKLHPLLVPWDDLPAPDQQRARDSIRALPAMLARAGFAVERRSDS